jgi:Protein of unknown function (DUF3606)
MTRDSSRYPPGRQPPQSEGRRLDIEAPGAEPPHAQDHWRINLDEEWERRFWSREFGVSEGDLRQAVGAVGNLAGSVRAHFERARKQPSP